MESQQARVLFMRDNQALPFAARRQRSGFTVYVSPYEADLISRLLAERDELLRLLSDWPY